MRLLCILLVWLSAFTARADESDARELFRAGVEALDDRDWPEAARLLEASLQQKDKAACRFNLVIAHREMHHPLEVARHAVAFLTNTAARSHSGEAEKVRAYLAEALRELTTVQLEGLPLGSHVTVDGAPPRVMDGTRMYESPGLHRFALWLGERQLESVDAELWPGATQPWPRVPAPPAVATEPEESQREVGADKVASKPPTPVSTPPHAAPPLQPIDRPAQQFSVRQKVAWTLGLTGAAVGLGAIGTYAFAAAQAHELHSWQTNERGYFSRATRYTRTQDSVIPLALAGGVLMASASALITHRPRAALAISIVTLVVGLAATTFGIVQMARSPKTLVEETTVTRPSVQAGSLCLGASLPLVTYGVRLQWDLWRGSGRSGR